MFFLGGGGGCKIYYGVVCPSVIEEREYETILTCVCLMAGGLPVKVFNDSKRVQLSRSLTHRD